MTWLAGGDGSPSERLRAGVAARVETGELRPGDRLPTVRALAEELGLATNTVAKAYRALETSGTVETRGRAGTFVTGDRVAAEAKSAATAYAARVRALGVGEAAALDLVRAALRG